MKKQKTLFIELELKKTTIDEEAILNTIYKALEATYGPGFVDTIDTIDTEEDQ